IGRAGETHRRVLAPGSCRDGWYPRRGELMDRERAETLLALSLAWLMLLLAVRSLDAAELPAALPGPAAIRSVSAAPEALGGPLVPGQVIQPIDLPSALRLAGARDLDVAIARERICQAVAELEQARVLWLPSLYLGPNWIRHDGQVQFVDGPVKAISKSSLFAW